MKEAFYSLLESPLLGMCICILIPMLFLLFLIKNKNTRTVLLFFGFGTLSGLVSFVFNNYFNAINGDSFFLITSIAIVIEESFKAAPLLLLVVFTKKLKKFNINLIYYGVALGFGFGVEETIYYYVQFLETNTAYELISSVILRSLSTSLMHGMTTGLIAGGILIFKNRRDILVPVICGLMSMAFTIHAIYNLMVAENILYVSFIIPIFIYIIGQIFIRKPEKNSISQGGKSDAKIDV